MAEDTEWTLWRVGFRAPDPDLAQELFAHAFREAGVRGVVLDDGLPESGPGSPGEGFRSVTGYLPAGRTGARLVKNLAREVAALSQRMGVAAAVTTDTLEEREWATAWKEHFHPVRISDRIVVRPSWEAYEARPGEIVIEVDPEMAFGTGTHATTRLCMRLLEESIAPGDRFLDIGTGSGILLITAARLGAGFCCGCDFDPVALAAAARNLVRNRVGPEIFALWQGDLLAAAGAGMFQVLAANIEGPVIEKLCPDLPRLLAPGGTAILSGIIPPQAGRVKRAADESGLCLVSEWEEEDWVAIKLSAP